MGTLRQKNALRDIAITTAGGNAANWGSHKSKIDTRVHTKHKLRQTLYAPHHHASNTYSFSPQTWPVVCVGAPEKACT